VTTPGTSRERLGSKEWANEAVRRIEADDNRSAETHLHAFPLPAESGIDLYLKDESVHPTGSPSPAYCLTINGAVEKVLVRGDWRIRVGLAGPGRAFGYGASSTVGRPRSPRSHARAILLVLPRDAFDQLFNGEDAVSRGLLDVIQRDLMATLRERSARARASLRASNEVPPEVPA
jgi:hypothetical protein